MGNSASSKEPPKFSWIGTGCVCALDLEVIWNHYSNHNKTILKEDAAAFVEQVVKQYEESKNGSLSLDEALVLENMGDTLTAAYDEISYKDFLKIFFTVLNKINITFAKDLRDVYLKVGMEQNVYLHIYDLNENVSKLNDCTIHLGFGAFHTGVEIFNRELSFGYPNGIFICKPKQASTGAIYRKSVLMGTVTVTNQELIEMIKAMKEEWKGDEYDVINANCNHFCNELCMKLLNKTLPSYLTKIADFMSLFVKDSQDIGLFDGKGSMSFSQSQSMNGSLAGIGDVKGATDAFEEKKVQPGEALNRLSSKNTLLPQMNIPEKKDAMNVSGEVLLENDSAKKVGRSSSKRSSSSGTRSKNNSGGSSMLNNPNKRLSPSTSSSNITPSSSPSASLVNSNRRISPSSSSSNITAGLSLNNSNKRISPSNSSSNIHATGSSSTLTNSKRLSPSTSSNSITPSSTPCSTPPSITPPLTPHIVVPRESMHNASSSTTKSSSTSIKPKKKKDAPEEANPTRLVSFAPDGKPEATTTRFISLIVEVDEAKSKTVEVSKTLMNCDDKTPVLEQQK